MPRQGRHLESLYRPPRRRAEECPTASIHVVKARIGMDQPESPGLDTTNAGLRKVVVGRQVSLVRDLTVGHILFARLTNTMQRHTASPAISYRTYNGLLRLRIARTARREGIRPIPRFAAIGRY